MIARWEEPPPQPEGYAEYDRDWHPRDVPRECRHQGGVAEYRKIIQQRNPELVIVSYCQRCGDIRLVEGDELARVSLRAVQRDYVVRLKERSRKAKSTFMERVVEANTFAATWRNWLHRYYQTKEWAQKCHAVKMRAGGWCECCRVEEIKDVHHLTYKNVGAEPLWELRGVCRNCHDELPRLERERGRYERLS